MCGIAGMAGIEDQGLLDAMLAVTRHRGPDDWGAYVAHGSTPGGRVCLGNNRLKILDLSAAGHQPMQASGAPIWVAYNGEIFNFRELREQLQQDGVTFRSQTDTEVLPYLYLKYATDMVHHLNGMFAFALWDGERQQLMIARDRMGVKPLYYTVADGCLYFASEIKALLLCPKVQARLDASVLREYLALLYVPNPNTMFEGIYKLPPGQLLLWHNGRLQIKKYWNGAEPVDYSPASESDLIDGCREVLKRAVRRQLISDVPVGFFLSGGLDSSTLVAAAREVHRGKLQCYTMAYSTADSRFEQSDEDAGYAALVAKHFGAEIHHIAADADVAGLLPKVVWHLDGPIADHAAIATYLICREAKATSTVLLSGQGADELFAGYRVHLVRHLNRWLRLVPSSLRRNAIHPLLTAAANHSNLIPGIKPGLMLAYSRFGKKLLNLVEMTDREQYIAMRSYLSPVEIGDLLLPDMADAATSTAEEALLRHFKDARGLDFINQMLYVDQQTFLPDLNLAYSDKLSMAASIEARVPFLDNEVVDFMRRVPPSLKLKGNTQKYILKKAMEGILPQQVIYRRKAGFGLPVRSWLRNELREMVGDLLSAERVAKRRIFRPESVTRMVQQNQSGERDYPLQIWSLLTLELWQQSFLDIHRPSASPVLAQN